MSDLTLTVPVFLDLDPGEAVLVKSSAAKNPAGRLRIVSGDKRLYSLRLHQTPEGSTWQRVGLPEGWTMVLSGKLAPGDSTAYFTNDEWAEVGSGTTLAYTATLDFAVASEFWGSPAASPRVVFFDVEIRDSENTVRGTWQFEAEVCRENYGSGDEPADPDSPFLDRTAADNIYLSFTSPQTLTSPQQAAIQAALGVTPFNASNPGAIGGGTAAAGTFTTTTTDGLVVATTVSRGGTVLGTSATDGRIQEWKDGSGNVVGWIDVDGNFSFGNGSGTSTIGGNLEVTGDLTAGSFVGNLVGNAGTATRLETPRAINGVNFDGTGAITVTAAAGTLTGTALNSTVVTSSLTAVGTITSGTWNGTAIGVVYGGTGVTSSTLGSLLYGSGTNTRASLSGNTSATMAVLTQTGDGTNSAAPVWTSTTGTGNVVRANSPTLVTPALGTPASGDLRNCSAATTSVAGVTTLATSAQAQTGSSTSLAVTPAALASRLMDPCFIPLSVATMRSFVSGSGYAIDSSKLAATTFTTTAGVGYSIASIGYPGLEGIGQPGVDRLTINFSKRIEISGAATLWTGYAGDANSTGRLMLGGKVTVTGGAPSSRAIGLSVAGAGANVFLNVHNGTSLATVDTGFAPSLNTPFSFRLISDGAGNVSLSINGATAVTSSAGPTGNSASGACFLSMVEGVSGNSTKFLFSLCHGWIYIAP